MPDDTQPKVKDMRSLVAWLLATAEREKRGEQGLVAASRVRTLEEVAAALGVSPERVRRIESRALRKLRARAQELGIGIDDLRD